MDDSIDGDWEGDDVGSRGRWYDNRGVEVVLEGVRLGDWVQLVSGIVSGGRAGSLCFFFLFFLASAVAAAGPLEIAIRATVEDLEGASFGVAAGGIGILVGGELEDGESQGILKYMLGRSMRSGQGGRNGNGWWRGGAILGGVDMRPEEL